MEGFELASPSNKAVKAGRRYCCRKGEEEDSYQCFVANSGFHKRKDRMLLAYHTFLLLHTHTHTTVMKSIKKEY